MSYETSNLEQVRRQPDAITVPPRERIVAAARDLFYRKGINTVGVDAVAEAANTNKMTLYRHFASKDELVAECLRRLSADIDAAWDRIAQNHPGDPKGQLLEWLDYMAEFKLGPQRGCAFANAAIELPNPDHPARRVVEAHKRESHDKVVALCRAAGLVDPEMLADQLFLLSEGARASVQSVGPHGPAARLADMFRRLVKAHEPPSA